MSLVQCSAVRCLLCRGGARHMCSVARHTACFAALVVPLQAHRLADQVAQQQARRRAAR
jgi:hypothetical protein